MKYIWMGILAAASAVCFCTLPRTGMDAAKLLPAQVLVIRQADGVVMVSSDLEVSGVGQTLEQAMEAMEENAPGTLFLDTAEHVVLCSDDARLLHETIWEDRLRPAAKLYLASDEVDTAAELVEYLQAHSGRVTQADARAALLRGQTLQLPHLEMAQNGGILLAQ